MSRSKVDVALILEIAEAFNSRDADRIMTYFTEDCTFFMASGPEPTGRAVRGKAPRVIPEPKTHTFLAGLDPMRIAA